ncbi:MAG: nitronate monooxygenase [Candidatus Abyssobacteria bacterium SURF_5]|uniref:Nitronate monooxygenase n=1 Tax=Abyssobacteria bacterium (strain SURF_5) TaxID=2093360 RepID=A0A3A4P3I0_ABYX5|nr:MAG: nitronate monooxygenase [Candidatus Abyssubacteria bacterium SURF_5]
MHPALNTTLCKHLGIEKPIVQAGMGFVARAELAAAVSAAGGLGVIGAAFLTLDELRDAIRQVKDRTDKPFGVDILFATYGRPSADPRVEEFTDEVRRQIDIVFEEGVPILASGLGNPAPVVPQAHELGIKVISLVGNTKNAKRVAAGGVDIVVAQGYDGGGHTGRVGTLALVPAVVDCVKQPVVAAGGIADGRGLVAALALGAVGVWMGTRFVASKEAYAHMNYKNKIAEIDDEGTVRTRCFTGKPCRVIKNRTSSEWETREAEIEPFPIQIQKISEYIGENIYEAARLHGKIDIGSCAAGQSSVLIHEVTSAADIVNKIVAEADEILTKLSA